MFKSNFFVLHHKAMPFSPPNGPHKGTGVFIINLDRSLLRYDYVLPQAQALQLPITRISGIDGKLLSETEIKHRNIMGHYPNKGTIGCSLSHITSWKKFLESNYQYALILEDDVSFDPLQLKQTIVQLESNPNWWDIANFETLHHGLPLTLKQFPATGNSLAIYLTEVTHAGAYLLSRKSALKLLDKALPIKMPIDHYFTRGWEFDLVFTGIEPRIVSQSFGDSEIKKTIIAKDEQKDPLTFTILWEKVSFKGKSYIIRFFYNLKIYLMK
jgi:GR25 family glycosyltransferase involved in LPS biosynthesis